MLKAYLNLTKPRISLLFGITGLAAIVLEGSMRPLHAVLVVLGILGVSGCANGLNQYFERDVDKSMRRTAQKRPLPLGQVTPKQALWFSCSLGVVALAVLWIVGGILAMALGAATIAFYSFYYTLWLKPRTPYNIVIGGAAGATAPLIAWAAATGGLAWTPWVLFALIFFWTPPHFWALALCCKEDYQNVGYPMLPVARGDQTTYNQIVWYSLSLWPLSILLVLWEPVSMMYLTAASVLSILFIALAILLRWRQSTRVGWQLFAYSIFYLLAIFVLLIVDTANRTA